MSHDEAHTGGESMRQAAGSKAIDALGGTARMERQESGPK